MRRFSRIIWPIGIVVVAAIGITSFFTSEAPSEILQAPDERLHRKSEPVVDFDTEIKQIAEELTNVIRKVDTSWSFSLGMAAPQIGYNKRLVALKESYGNYLLMANPEVIEQKWSFFSPSRCFSLKGIHFLKRYFWMKVRFQDLDGNKSEIVFRGPKAATMQQEIDHLNGILLTDY